jgi:hypothetical protein
MYLRHALLAAGVLLGMLLVPARAEVPPVDTLGASPGGGPVVETLEISGTLAALDAETRQVTLDVGNGATMSFVAGPEVRNFAQLEVGDLVKIEYARGLLLELRKGSTEQPWRIDDDRTRRAMPGEKPAGTIGQGVRALVEVVAVDTERGTITVRGPRKTVELGVPDPVQLEKIAVGDRIEVTYIEAGAISVSAPAQ